MRPAWHWASVCLISAVLSLTPPATAAPTATPATVLTPEVGSQARRPKTDAEVRFWLENMVWYHRYSSAEITSATGLTAAEITAACRRFRISPESRPPTDPRRMLVRPYPGGRHPRIGFLDGAIDPQRDTKMSIFTPWDSGSYVVCDFPEAIWSNLGLTYLAHTHVPTIWSKAGVTLPAQEWQQLPRGEWRMERTLPNGIRFGTRVIPKRDHVEFDLWLHNGTQQTLTDLRVQNCVMLKAAAGFNAQTNANKQIRPPYVACRSETGNRWIISGWEPIHRPWANPPVPCLHADPKFPDCPPGTTRHARGWISFYEGTDLEAELKRITGTRWHTR